MLELFNFKGKNIRFVNGKPVAKDVAEVLGYADPVSTISKRIKSKYKGVDKMATAGGVQSVTVLEEGGIYQLVLGSKLESADEFQDWLFEEVLPSIRKTGSYSINQPVLPTTYLEALKCLVVAEEEKIKLQQEVEHQKLLASIKDDVIAQQNETIGKWHPMVENYKQFLDADGLISMSQAGKMFNTGRNRFITVLQLLGFFLQDKPEPLQKWMKYFELKVKVRKHPSTDGKYKSDVVTLFKPEGLNSVVELMVGKVGSQEKLLEYLEKPSLLIAKLEAEKARKREEAINQVENTLENVIFS